MNILRKQKGLALLIMMSGFFLLLLTLEFAILGMTEVTLHRLSYIKRKEVASSLMDMGVIYARMIKDKHNDTVPEKVFPPETLTKGGSETVYISYDEWFNPSKKEKEPDKIYISQGTSVEVDREKLEELMEKPDLEKLVQETYPSGINPGDIQLVSKDAGTLYTTYTSPPLVGKGFFTLDYYCSGDMVQKVISTGHFDGVTCSVEVK